MSEKGADKTEILGPGASAPVDALPRLGRYRLEKKIGQGGMADIYLARAEGPAGFEKQVVIKKIRAQLGRNHKFVEMFLREARLLATLNHANIVRIFELGEDEGEYFLALEYLEGLSLRDIAERWWHAKKTLPIEGLLRVIADAALGLEHAHGFKDARGIPANLIHRDVSPDNLFVTTAGVTKLLDFGIAKREGIDMLTQAGEIKGKIPFMSPEALQGYPLDRRSDIWSLGVVMFWLLAGRRPFDGTSDLHTMKAILEDEAPDVRQLNDQVPKPLASIVMQCLEKDREKRTKSAGAVYAAVTELVRMLPRGAAGPQLLVKDALMLKGVDYEVRPKVAPALPMTTWPTAGVQPVGFNHDAPTHARIPIDEESLEYEGESGAEAAASGLDPATEQFEVQTAADVPRAQLPRPPPMAEAATMPLVALPDPVSDPVIHVERVSADGAGEVDTDTADTDAPRAPAPPLVVPAARLQPRPRPPQMSAREERRSGSALPVMLGAMTALVFVAGVLWFLGVIDDVRAILVHPAGVVDAGASVVAMQDEDAGGAVVATSTMSATDAGAGATDASADAGVARATTAVALDAGSVLDAGSEEPAVRKVFVLAPSSIEWRDGDGDALIDGKGLLKLPRAERVVLAVDRKRSCTARVPLSDQLDRIDYTKLPRGKLIVKAKRGTDVFLGSDKIGTAPMKREIEVFAGTCDLRTRLRGNERRQPVEIRAGRTTTVTIR